MYTIKELKKKKTYVMPQKPKFKTRKSEIAWLRRQKMNAFMLNIKSIKIQVKDIKELIYSNDPYLLSLYSLYYPFDCYMDEEYITISKFKAGNFMYIYSILNTDWLINKDVIDKVGSEVLELECAYLEKRIEDLSKKSKTDIVINCLEHCRYKLSTIKEVLEERNKEKSISLKLV